MVYLKAFFAGIFFTSAITVVAQNSGKVVFIPTQVCSSDSITKLKLINIIILGNKKTKYYVIEREIPFKKYDSILPARLPELLKQAKEQIYNSSLFNEVNVEARVIGKTDLEIVVEVKERWYIYPIPQFKIVDRNFNEWFNTYHASLKRINYGVKFVDYNLSGRKDQLRLYLLNGYSRNISFSYSEPYSNHALTTGFALGAGYAQNKEINYKISYNNKILWFPGDSLKNQIPSFVSNNWYINAGYSVRKGFFTRHVFNAGYFFSKVNDTILTAAFNPGYFNTTKSSAGYIDIFYMLQYVHLNNISYPLVGRSTFISFLKRGLSFSGGINAFIVEAGYSRYFALAKGWFTNIQGNTKLKLPFRQAYINQRALGYGDSYLRGLEYYVIDGAVSGLVKTTLRKKIIEFRIPFPFNSKTHPFIPFTIFAKTFTDAGYVYNTKDFYTFLNNRFLYTGGIGIDIVTLYDFNIRLEYSFNQLNENGLFLHTQSGF